MAKPIWVLALWAGGLLIIALTVAFPAIDGREMGASQPVQAKQMLDLWYDDGVVFAVGQYGCIQRIKINGDVSPVRGTVRYSSERMLTSVHFLDRNRGWAAGYDATIIATIDSGTTWVIQHRDENRPPIFDVRFNGSLNGVAVGAFGSMLTTSDGGRHWLRSQLADDVHLYAIEVPKKGVFIIAGEGGALYKSRDGGASWTRQRVPTQSTLFGLVWSRATGALVAYGVRGAVIRSTDDGENWVNVKIDSASTFLSGATLPGGRLVLGAADGSLQLSLDGGESFSRWVAARERAKVLALVNTGRGNVLLSTQNGLVQSKL